MNRVRSRVGFLAAAILSAWCGVCAAEARPANGPEPMVEAARSGTPAKLAKPLTLDLTDSRLEDVITFLKDFSGIDIDPLWLDEQSTDGLDKDQRITISVKDVTVITFIERLCQKVRSDLSPVTWQYSADGGVEIGPKSRLNKHGYMKMYDLQDLLFEIPNFAEAPKLDMDQVLNQGQSGGGGSGGGIFEDEDEDNTKPKTQEELARQLTDLITEFVEPEQWQDNGGDGGTIRFYNGYLLIRAPDYIHRQLSGGPVIPGAGRNSAGRPSADAGPASPPATSQTAGTPGQPTYPPAPASEKKPAQR